MNACLWRVFFWLFRQVVRWFMGQKWKANEILPLKHKVFITRGGAGHSKHYRGPQIYTAGLQCSVDMLTLVSTLLYTKRITRSNSSSDMVMKGHRRRCSKTSTLQKLLNIYLLFTASYLRHYIPANALISMEDDKSFVTFRCCLTIAANKPVNTGLLYRSNKTYKRQTLR